tara:strand:- start:351 stop:743 length:393 start_codon:yes stop_codon:yes gene_type:complete
MKLFDLGVRRRFGLAGIVNVLITNLVLQCLLVSDLFGIYLSTLISQIVNAIFGYFIYGKIVFKEKVIRKLDKLIKYCSLMILLWMLNGFCIDLAFTNNIPKNITAAFMIPILALISYLSQKKFIFYSSNH